jgi:hypothetical protein
MARRLYDFPFLEEEEKVIPAYINKLRDLEMVARRVGVFVDLGKGFYNTPSNYVSPLYSVPLISAASDAGYKPISLSQAMHFFRDACIMERDYQEHLRTGLEYPFHPLRHLASWYGLEQWCHLYDAIDGLYRLWALPDVRESGSNSVLEVNGLI